MRFFQVVLSGAALFAAALALELNEVPTELEAGKTYTITYSPKDNTPTTFILRKGDPGDLDTIGTIGTATGGSFTWTVPTDLVDGPDYAFEVQQEGVEPNFSGLIPLSGGTGEETSSSSTMSSGYPTKSTPMSTPSTPTPSLTEETTKSTPMPSGTGSMTTPGMNSTITSATLSRTTSGGGAPTTTGGGSPPAEQTGAAAIFGSSPLALLVGAAAMAYLN